MFIADLISAAFLTSTTDVSRKKEAALIWILFAATLGSLYFYSELGLSQKQTEKLQSMQNVSNKYHLNDTLAALEKLRADGSINKGEYWTIKDVYKNESFKKNYELVKAKS